MAANSNIEWTDHTFNPWVGCTKVGPGCDHCYAEGWAKRAGKAAGVEWGGERRRTSEANWRQPLKWNEQAQREGLRFRVFCASLADVFDNQVPAKWRADLFALIEKTPHLDWLLLTKRVGNVTPMMIDVAASLFWMDRLGTGALPSNVWLGATVVNQEEADRDVPKLLRVPARVHFLSIEPMLGPIDLRRIVLSECPIDLTEHGRASYPGLQRVAIVVNALKGSKQLGMAPLSWVIAGGESGPAARLMHPEWPRSLRDQCARAVVPFLFKQWGEWAPAESINDDDKRNLAERWINVDGFEPAPGQGADFFRGDEVLYRAGKKAAGRQLDGQLHDGIPKPTTDEAQP